MTVFTYHALLNLSSNWHLCVRQPNLQQCCHLIVINRHLLLTNEILWNGIMLLCTPTCKFERQWSSLWIKANISQKNNGKLIKLVTTFYVSNSICCWLHRSLKELALKKDNWFICLQKENSRLFDMLFDMFCPRSLNPGKALAMAICPTICLFYDLACTLMHDVAREFACAVRMRRNN